jgi:putative intracellular protease/amidase
MTKVLIVLTGAKEWSLKDGSKHFGGVWSPEFVYPHDRFSKAGYEVVVATLGGAPAPVDPASLSLGLQENDQTSCAGKGHARRLRLQSLSVCEGEH